MRITAETPIEEIEALLDHSKSVMTPEFKAQLEEAARNTLRKQAERDAVRTDLMLSPAARKRLEEMADEAGSLSAAANQLILR